MQTSIHFWSYLAQFFLELEIFQTNLQRKSKQTFYVSITFYPNSAIYKKKLRAEQIEVRKRLLSFGAESFVFQVAIQKFKD